MPHKRSRCLVWLTAVALLFSLTLAPALVALDKDATTQKSTKSTQTKKKGGSASSAKSKGKKKGAGDKAKGKSSSQAAKVGYKEDKTVMKKKPQ